MSQSFHVETVQLSQFTQGNERERGEFIRVLGDSLRNTGFVKVAGHQVTAEAVSAAYRDVKAFFDLPAEVKQKYRLPNGGGARGYTPFGQEHAKDNPVGDLKEFWHVGQELPQGHALKSVYADNLWPTEVATFRDSVSGLYRALERCAETLLEGVALYLDLPRRHLADMIIDGNSVFRLLHYPALKECFVPGAVRSAAHEDINLITLLPAATEAGLELMDRDGKWHVVDAGPNEIVADAGDMLSRHVNLEIPSTTHRVVNPADANAVRYSMPFFCHPRPEVMLDCPAPLLKHGKKKHFEPITAHDYLGQRLREIGLY